MGVQISQINNNVLANRWKSRYEALPDDKKDKIAKLNASSLHDYQLKEIKKSRVYPKVGDVILINPVQEVSLYGVVLNNHINSICGDDLLLVAILRVETKLDVIFEKGIDLDDLLLPPAIVGKEYWTKGYFARVGEWKNPRINVKYGFLRIINGKYLDEHGHDVEEEPELLGMFGVTTISGIAREINQELIIAGIL